MNKVKLTLLTVAALAVTGCTSTQYTDPSGASFKRVSLFSKQSVGKVEVTAGDKTLVLEGYSNESTETAAAVAGAVASALKP